MSVSFTRHFSTISWLFGKTHQNENNYQPMTNETNPSCQIFPCNLPSINPYWQTRLYFTQNEEKLTKMRHIVCGRPYFTPNAVD